MKTIDEILDELCYLMEDGSVHPWDVANLILINDNHKEIGTTKWYDKKDGEYLNQVFSAFDNIEFRITSEKDNKVIFTINNKLFDYERFDKELSNIEESPEYHYFLGRAFDYPECCIKGFIEKTSNYDELLITDKECIMTFNNRKIDRLKFKNILYNFVLDDPIFYVFHRPCSIYCDKSSILGNKYKEVLESYRIYSSEIPQRQLELIAGWIYKNDYSLDKLNALVSNAFRLHCP